MERKAVNIQPYTQPINDRCPHVSPWGVLGCYIEGDLRRRWMEYLITQYREIHQHYGAWSKEQPFSDGQPAPSRLVQFFCGYLNELENVLEAICNPCIDIDTADCACLCMLGQLAGFPCHHCDVLATPYFDMCPNETRVVKDCDGNEQKYVVYFETKSACGPIRCNNEPLYTDFEFDTCTEDGAALYRRFLAAFQVKKRSRGLGDEVIEAAQKLWPDDNPQIVYQGDGEILLDIGRPLDDEEILFQKLYRKVLPSPRGVMVHFAENLNCTNQVLH